MKDTHNVTLDDCYIDYIISGNKCNKWANSPYI